MSLNPAKCFRGNLRAGQRVGRRTGKEVALDDSGLVRRAQHGDLEAFDELVRRHQRAALRVAMAVAGHSRAADAAQEGFVRAFRSLHRCDADRPFRPWLLRIVANAAKNELRSMDRHHRIDLRVNMLTLVSQQIDADVADTAVAGERRAALIEGLRALSHDDRLILALRWFEDLAEAEIAEALGVRRGTVKSRLSRAMGRLRDELGGGDD